MSAIYLVGLGAMEYFWNIVSKGDNIPIALLIPIAIFFTFVALRQAFSNDKLIEQGRQKEILDEMQK